MLRLLLLIIALGLLLMACGQYGALHLPEQAPVEKQK